MAWPLLLNTTTFCNAKCKFCIVYDKLNRPELNMTDEQVYDALRQSRARGSTEVGYSGGEPSIDPRIIDFVRYATGLGFTHQSMNTNGIKFKQKQFCEDIIEAGLTNIDISVHGHTDELHDGLVAKRGALAAIRDACANLRGLHTQRRFHLSATIVIARDNYTHLRDICAFLDSLGVTHKRLKYAYEGNLTHDMIVEQVAPYQEIIPFITDALEYLATRKYSFCITHVPMCLLGDHAAFSQDFERRNAVMAFDDHQDFGDPAHYFRKDWDACADCVVNNLCTRLDGTYEQFHGRPALVPFTSHAQVEALFANALTRFPGASETIRRTLQLYQQNRDVEPPKQQRVDLS
jgi:MoaA/NifB/PqqE/SkfB family radical SAM enzyme